MTRQQEMAQQLRDNPAQQRAVYGDEEKDANGKPVPNGRYFAALALRLTTGIYSAVIEFPSKKNVPMLILGMLQGLEDGGDPRESARRFIEIENLAMASTMETADTKGLARIKREVDFDKKQALTPDLLGID